MENVDEFEKQFQKLLQDAKDKLEMTDETLTYILLREGTAYYLRTICREHLQDTPEHKS